jgi:hypothetical protein
MRKLLRVAVNLSAAFAGYIVAVLALRPWFTTWGATEEEIEKRLPGDEIMKRGASSVHAISINAPRTEVWKWLVQIGQDRAGFYSYSALENIFRADIHNADRIVPDWQDLEAGDFIRLASKEQYGDFPLLRVNAVEKNHYIVLERWGAFVLEEIDPKTTRLIIRSHEGNPLGGRLLNTLFWEPAHFIMELGMLHGIKRRAERDA